MLAGIYLQDEYASARGYDRRHQKWRLLILARDPICKICDREPSTEADHIDGDNTNLSGANGQGLCKSCHAVKTREQTGNGLSKGCNSDGIPTDKRHHWN